MSTFATTILIGLGLLFIAAGSVQYNDPDPFFWLAIYGVSAATLFAAPFVGVPRWILVLEVLVAVVGIAVVLATGSGIALADTEEMRELGGLVLVVIGALTAWGLGVSPWERRVDGRVVH